MLVSANILEARHWQDEQEFKEDENTAIGKMIQVRDASTLEKRCLRHHAPGTRASWPWLNRHVPGTVTVLPAGRTSTYLKQT